MHWPVMMAVTGCLIDRRANGVSAVASRVQVRGPQTHCQLLCQLQDGGTTTGRQENYKRGPKADLGLS
jgi:hypothetical protein